MISVPVSSSVNCEIKWAAQLSHVREVSLVGAADLHFWKTWLLREGLAPAEDGGKAQILITSAAGRFGGVAFRELSFSAMVMLEEQAAPAAFLLGAFNSSRFFAFCERVIFSTPCEYGDVRVSTTPPASIDLLQQGATVFQASMRSAASNASSEPTIVEDGGWEGPVLLPSGDNDVASKKMFYARIKGPTAVYPFISNVDLMTIKPRDGDGVLSALRDCSFVASEWHVREDAVHAKSKTYRRDRTIPSLHPSPRRFG